ncbi:hypothetical protein MSIBF_A1680011 [groundwater metagenome]|uniref:InsA N-terminal domain-containing protein n=1 Tax=groundwater metagenome TaxID=717931 RepID=A0A098E9W6_9ZZZZ
MKGYVELIICPECCAGNIKLNGHIHNGKQNYRCKVCGREFVLNLEKKLFQRKRYLLSKSYYWSE